MTFDSLEGKVVLVTGGARGIGKGLAAACLAEGAKVIITNLNAEVGRQAQDELSALGHVRSVRCYGLKPGDIRRAAAFLIQGEEVGDLFVGGKTYDVNVWSLPSSRDSLNDIENLLIDTPDGGLVRLVDVASVKIVPAPNVIEREGQSRKQMSQPT